MDIHYHTCNFSRLPAICFCMIALLVTPAASDYINETVTDQNDPTYWLDQGGLFATYGNFPAAIEAYKKALALDADNSDAYFNMGVAYGEMGEYDQALVVINKAIALDAENDRYYYGRAWILLMTGERIDAMNDFEKAAQMGNLDAIHYLQQ